MELNPWKSERTVLYLWFFTVCWVVTYSQCNRRRIIHHITYRNCQPKRVLSWGCSGTCNSYSRPSQTEPERLERFCQCCREMEIRIRRVRLLCPSRHNAFRHRIIRVKIPKSCSCRPCSYLPDRVIPSEENHQSTWITLKNVLKRLNPWRQLPKNLNPCEDNHQRIWILVKTILLNNITDELESLWIKSPKNLNPCEKHHQSMWILLKSTTKALKSLWRTLPKNLYPCEQNHKRTQKNLNHQRLWMTLFKATYKSLSYYSGPCTIDEHYHSQWIEIDHWARMR